MKASHQRLTERLISKALSSPCKYKIAAAGIDYRGRIVSIFTNSKRINKTGGGIHAEQAVIYRSPRSVKTILIVRVSKTGKLLPIHPCEKCRRMAERFGVSINGAI